MLVYLKRATHTLGENNQTRAEKITQMLLRKIIHNTQTPMSTSRFTLSPKIPQQNKQLKKEEPTANFCHNEQINLQDLYISNKINR